MKEQLIALFGGAKPTVRQYHELINCMPLEERGIFFDRTFGLALSGYVELTCLPPVSRSVDQGEPPAVCGLCPAKDGAG